MTTHGAPVPVRLRALWRGEDLDAEGRAAVEQGRLRVALDGARPPLLEVPFTALDGASFDRTVLAAYVHGGDVLELRTRDGEPPAALAALAARLEAAACALPEQTLSLRGFGSERSAPGSDHDRWFGALLDARRAAADATTIAAQLRAFEAGALARHARETIAAFAAERHGEAGPHRRALQHELEELAEGTFAAVARLEVAAKAVREGEGDQRYVTWRAWAAALGRAFHAADDTWLAMVPVLCDPRGAGGRLWRRVLRRGGDA
jgi:hypothetical protein